MIVFSHFLVLFASITVLDFIQLYVLSAKLLFCCEFTTLLFQDLHVHGNAAQLGQNVM